MTEPIYVVWALLRTVSDRCEALTWHIESEDDIQKPDYWNSDHARIEYRIFGIFLLSHAMTHFGHNINARDQAIYFCIDSLAVEFQKVSIEGNDFAELASSRFELYGQLDNNDNEVGMWATHLRYCLGAQGLVPIKLNPPLVVGNFIEQAHVELHLLNCITNLFMPAFYAHIARICEMHRNIYAITIAEMESCLKPRPPV